MKVIEVLPILCFCSGIVPQNVNDGESVNDKSV